jgi:flagellar assembly protein FliH
VSAADEATRAAQREAEQARVEAQYREAVKRGHDEGFERGLREGREEYLAVCARMQGVIDALSHAKDEVTAQLEPAAVEMVLEAIAMVLGRATAGREGMVALVEQVVSGLRGRQCVEVRLHPDDLALLGGVDIALSSGMTVQWQADASLVLGGCVVVTPGGDLDARLDRVVEAFRQSMLTARIRMDEGSGDAALS